MFDLLQALPLRRRHLPAGMLAALAVLAAAIPAAAQTVTTNGAYTVLRYTASGSFTVPAGVTGVDYVIVGGGGGGGGNRGGGGGAGGVRIGSVAVTPGAAYTVTVGAGGAAAAAGTASSVAFPTVVTAAGGGAGGHVGFGGGSGGSGGGAGAGTASPGGTGTSGQGSAGGGGSTAGSFGGAGGGGGFSAAGGTGTSGSAAALTGTGGAGYTETLTGLNLRLAGGGGGGVQRSGDSTVGSAGATAFGGGNGSGANATAGSGAAGTGGGGGGGGATVSGVGGSGGPGGSGTVILRYLTPPPVLTAVTIASNNANPARARSGDTVTVTFTADRPLNPAATAVLRGWYPLDGTREDPTFVGPTLTDSPAPAATFAAGLVGQAASFTGSNQQYLRAALNASGHTNPTFTWGAWVKVNNAAVWSTPLSNDDGGWDRFVSMHSGVWAVSFNGQNWSTIPATTNWTFIAQTFDGVTQRLYVDANPVFAVADPGPQVMHPHIDIGRNADAGTGFPGLIDGVFFFDDALSPAQVETIRAGGPGGAGVLRVGGRTVVATIAGRRAAVTHVSGNTWRATQTLAGADPVGPVAFTLNFADTNGLSGATATATTDASAVVLDLSAPVVASVGKPADGTYGPGQHLDFTVTFSEAIAVTGTPRLALTVGATATFADFLSLANATTATFRYTVPVGAADTDGVAVGALALNGGTITDLAGHAATLTLGTVPSTAGVRVDGVAPTLGAVAAGSTVEGNPFTFSAAPFTAAYADAQGSPLAALTLVSLPAVGALQFGGVAVETGQSIPLGQLGQLTYVPASGDVGTRTFQVAASDGFSLSAAAPVSVEVTPAGTVVNSLVVSGAALSIGVNGEVSLVETTALQAGARVVGVDLALEYSTYWPSSNPAFAGNYVKLAGAVVPGLDWNSLGNANGWTTVTRSYRGLVPGYVSGALNTWVFGSAYNPVGLRAISLRLYYTAANLAPALPASSLQLVYETVTPARVGNSIVYSVNRAAELAGLAFSRVHYRMDLTVGGVPRYAEASFDPWTGLTLAQLAVPTPAAPAAIQRNVANLTVVSNYPGVVNATGQTGRLELWDRDYFPPADGGVGGNADLYDFDDQIQTFGAYGSFQVHNLSSGPPQTVLAWNNHGALAPTNAPEIGFGNSPGPHPDWTFAAAANLGTAGWKLRISVQTVSLPASFAFTEDTAGPIRFFGTPFADPDSATLTVTLAVADGTLTAQPGNNLTLGGTATARTFTGTLADLNAYFTTAGRITYQGALHNTAARTLTVTVSDGALSASTTRPLTFTPVPDAPTLGAIAAAGSEDTPVAFTAALFTGAFADPDGDALASVTVATLPATGTLKLSGTAVLAGQTIPAAQLANLVYEPAAHDHGAHPFTVTASDGALSSAAATVTITLAPVNDAPTATAPATATTAEDTPVPFTGPLALAAADIDGDLATLRLTATNGTVAVTLGSGAVLSAGANASATLTLAGTQGQLLETLASAVYTPAPDYHGAATLTLLATDGAAATATATVALTVTPVADIVADALVTAEDNILTANLLTGTGGATADTFENPAAAVTAVTQGAHGTVGFTAAGLVTYTPAPHYHGTDSFTYTVTSAGLTETAAVTVTIVPVNDAPAHVAPASVAVVEDTPFAFAGPAALAVADLDSAALTTALLVTRGTLAVSLAGTGATLVGGANASAALTLAGTPAQLGAALATLVYLPAPDVNGADTLTLVTTDDGTPPLATATTVTLAVAAVADIAPDALVVAEDSAVTANLLTGTGGATADTFENPAAALTAVTAPAHGAVTFTAAGAVTYTPVADFHGTDSFTYTVTSAGSTETATVVVTVTPVNDGPVNTAPAAATLAEDTPFAFTAGHALAVADVDANIASVRLTAVAGTVAVDLTGGATLSAGANASATLTLAGTTAQLNAALAAAVFTPAADFHGAASLVLLTTDLTGAAASSTVALTVTPVADIAADTLTVAEDASATLAVLANDSFENPAAAVTAVTAPAHGTVSFTATAVTYTPAANFHGTDAFAYTVTSGGVTETAAVAVTVTSVNDLPVATGPATATLAEDTPLAFTAENALAVADIDGDLATLRLTATQGTVAVTLGSGAVISAGANATATLTLAGTQGQLLETLATAVFTPTPDYYGAATLTLLATDAAAATSTVTVALTVTPVADIRAQGLNLTEDFAPVTLTPLVGATFAPTAAITAITLPAHGTASFTGTTLTYQPAAHYHGTDSFTYTVTSGGVTETASVSIAVAPVNDVPVATGPATATFAEDTPLAFTAENALAVADIDGDLATLRLTATQGTVAVTLGSGAVISAGANATATLTLAGTQGQLLETLATAVFTPTPDYYGAATLTLLATDGAAATSTVTVALTITPVADIAADTLAVVEDAAPTAIAVLANDTFENTPVVTAVTAPAHGTVSFTATAVTYTPAADFNGADTFTYTVTSGGVTETAAVSVAVSSVNDAPVLAAPATATTDANTPFVFTGAATLALADVDAGAAPLTVTLSVTSGTLTLGATAGLAFAAGDGTADAALAFTGSLAALNAALAQATFAPAPGFSGPVTFALAVDDLGNTGAGGPLAAQRTVALTVRDTIPPVVTGLAAVTPDGFYKAGAVLDLTVAFSEPVLVDLAGGTPALALAVGSAGGLAAYVSGSGTPTLVFRYTVAPGDNSADLNHADPSALALRGGLIRDPAGNAAVLTLPATAPGTPGALATAAALVVDTVAPALVLSGPSVAATGSGPVTFTVTYSDAHGPVPTLTLADITLVRTATDARLVTADAAVAVSGTGLVRTVTLSGLTGDGLLAVSLAAGTAVDAAGNLAAAAGPSAAVTVTNTFPIQLVTSPAAADVAVGMPLSLAVAVTGTAPAYQWFRDGDPVPGATAAKLEWLGAPLAAAGTYVVRVANPLGAVDSAPVLVRVLDVSGTHAAVGPGYVPGQPVTLRHSLVFTGGDGTFRWSLLLPPGWTYLDGESSAEVRPAAGAAELLEWTWRSFPLSPVAFTARLRAPAGAAGPQSFAAAVAFTRAGLTVPLLVRPDPLVLPEIGRHSADTDADGRLHLVELLRVIELYNVRLGAQRTGAYTVAAGTEDGFAPAFGRAPGEPAGLAAWHTADTDRDGRLGLVELTRVIELYNHRVGTLRTGEYHRLAGSEDGFAPGPGTSAP